MASAVIGATLYCSKIVDGDRVGGRRIRLLQMQKCFDGIDPLPHYHFLFSVPRMDQARSE